MGRPAFKPTKEQRRTVKNLAALGMRHDHIAVVIGVRSPKTVRKHFRKELSMGFAEAVASVARVAYEMAISQKYPEMTEYWLSIMGEAPDPADSCEADESARAAKSTCEMVFVTSRDRDTKREVPDAEKEV